jgi:hypothetical protein
MDPDADPDPAILLIFLSDLQDINKKFIFFLSFFAYCFWRYCTFTSCKVIKKHKTVGMSVFFKLFLLDDRRIWIRIWIRDEFQATVGAENLCRKSYFRQLELR